MDPVAYACRIAEHAGWYAHYNTHDIIGMFSRGCSLYGPRGMKLIRLGIGPWLGVYKIDGSTCRKRRIVWLAILEHSLDPAEEKWLLIIETKSYGTWRKQEYVITGAEALRIFASYWRGSTNQQTLLPTLARTKSLIHEVRAVVEDCFYSICYGVYIPPWLYAIPLLLSNYTRTDLAFEWCGQECVDDYPADACYTDFDCINDSANYCIDYCMNPEKYDRELIMIEEDEGD